MSRVTGDGAQEVVSDARELQRPPDASHDLGGRVARLEARGAAAASAPTLTPKFIALVASLIAAVVPLTTALQAWLENRSDLAIAKQQQEHAMRMDYVKTVLSAEATERDREARLRLLIAILEPDDRLARWAQDELDLVKHRISELQTEAEQANAAAAAAKALEQQAQAKLAEINAKLKRTSKSAGSSPTHTAAVETPPAVERELAAAESEARTARLQAAEATRRALSVRTALGGAANKLLGEMAAAE